jgi:hypothetical protein
MLIGGSRKRNHLKYCCQINMEYQMSSAHIDQLLGKEYPNKRVDKENNIIRFTKDRYDIHGVR